MGKDLHIFNGNEVIATELPVLLNQNFDVLNTKQASNGIFYIEGNSTNSGVWLGTHSDITEYFPGLTIAYKINIAGASGLTLNINDLGAVPVVRNATTAVTTHYAVNSIVILTYTVDSGAAYWKLSDYDSDTKTRSSNKADSKMYIIGATTQSTSGQTTYSNKNCYIGSDNCLYSNGKKVVTADEAVNKATTLEGYGITDAYTKTEVDNKVANVVNSAPETLDTLKELSTALGNDPNFATTIATQIGKKANTDDLAKVATSGSYGDLNNKPDIYMKDDVDLYVGILASAIDQCVTLSGEQTISGKKTFGAISEKDGEVRLAYLDADNGWMVTGLDNATDQNLLGTTLYSEDGIMAIGNSDVTTVGIYAPNGITLLNGDNGGAITVTDKGVVLNGSPICTASNTYNKSEVDGLIADNLSSKGGTFNGETVVVEATETAPAKLGTIYRTTETSPQLQIVSHNFNDDGELADANGSAFYMDEGSAAILGAEEAGIVSRNCMLAVSGDETAPFIVAPSGDFNKMLAYMEGYGWILGFRPIITSINGWTASLDGSGALTIPNATTTKEGLLSPSDKAVIDRLASIIDADGVSY